MKLRQDELANFVATTLQNIRAGLVTALDAGVIVRMPEGVQFTLDVIHSRNAITNTVATVTAAATSTMTEVHQAGATGSNTTEEYTY